MTTIASAQPLGGQTLDIGLVFKQGWRLFVKDIGPLIIGTLIVAALSPVTWASWPGRSRPACTAWSSSA